MSSALADAGHRRGRRVLRVIAPARTVAALSICLATFAFAAGPAQAKARPDLTAQITLQPAEIVASGATRIAFKISNRGRARAKASSASVYLSSDAARGRGDRRVLRVPVDGLKARGSSARTVELKLPVLERVADWRIVVCADDPSRLKESKESNNCGASEPTQVFPPGLFVSGSGSDFGPGTMEQPLATIRAAEIALSGGGQIYVAAGEQPPFELLTGVHVSGGYDPITWRAGAGTTSIAGAPAVSARSVSGAGLENVSIIGQRDGATAVGLLAVDSDLTLLDTEIVAAPGSPGADASDLAGRAAAGSDGRIGDPGRESSAQVFCSHGALPLGGPGGASPAGNRGGKGGVPGRGTSAGGPGDDGTGPLAGAGGGGVPAGGDPALSAYVGDEGGDGAAGAPGPPGSPAFSPAGYLPVSGGDGEVGSSGSGGGGGGGGGGGSANCDSYGGAGGGGGGGGVGGQPGEGGGSAGGSIAAYLWDTSLVSDGSSLTASAGGAGGHGGAGQQGGLGGVGGPTSAYGGSSGQDDATNGAPGGDGGDGGDGGPGGGGAGGPSIAVLLGGASTFSGTRTALEFGSGGSGGNSSGIDGPTGIAAATFRP